MRQADRHDRGRPRADQPRERKPPARPHPSRGDHLHHHHDSTTMRRCNVLCLHGTSCSKCWLILHEEDVLCIRCHAHVPLSTQKQPFKRERCDLMHGHGWPHHTPEASSRACVASHSDVSHGPARPDHEQSWLLRFVCDAWAKIQAIFQRFSAVLKHGSWLIMSLCTCRRQPRGLVQGRFVT